MDNVTSPKEKPLYKKWQFWVIAVPIFIIILSAIFGSSTPPVKTSPVPAVSSVPLTPQEQAISTIGNDALKGTMDITYSDVKVSSDDSDRPAGSKLAVVSFDVSNYLNKQTLTTDTSDISSKVIQGVFANDPKIYDVIVWFHEPDLVDRYGNPATQNVIVSQSMDRPTFEKINWSGFDQSNLCNFLNQEATISGTSNTVCAVNNSVVR